jgi:indole-3-acetate monooxygenase
MEHWSWRFPWRNSRHLGQRRTASVTDLFVPTTLSLQDAPVQSDPLYSLPFIALTLTAVAAVPLGIVRHTIDILTEPTGRRIATRSLRILGEETTFQTNLGRAEALTRFGQAFLHPSLGEAWQTATAGHSRTMLWLASTHAAVAAKLAAELMFAPTAQLRYL